MNVPYYIPTADGKADNSTQFIDKGGNTAQPIQFNYKAENNAHVKMSSVIINYQNFLFICVLTHSHTLWCGRAYSRHTHNWIMYDVG